MRPKNVILFVVDALYQGRLGLAGHQPSASPTLDRLAGGGLAFTQAISTGSPTQFALPAIHTSTLPLDHGGYDHGIGRRGATLAESFAAGGYRTLGVSFGGVFSSYGGYDRGYDRFVTLQSPVNGVLDVLTVHQRYLAPRLRAGSMSLRQCLEVVHPQIEALFAWQRGLCDEREQEVESGRVPLSPLLHNWDYALVRDLIELEAGWFARDPERYVERLLSAEGSDYQTRLQSLVREHAPPIPREFASSAYRALGIPEAHGPHLSWASGAYVLERFTTEVEDLGEAPFFATVHLLDVHEYNFLSFDSHAGDWSRLYAEVEQARELQGRIAAHGDAYWGTPAYAYGIQYLDAQIRKALERLDRLGVLQDTIVAVTADHGWNHGHSPLRDFDVVGMADENVHVPFILHGPGVPVRRDDGLCSLLDVAPTLLDLAGLAAPESFRGESLVSREAPRPLVLMEHLGRGPCDFARKPLRIAARTERLKVVAEVPPLAEGRNGRVVALHNLILDPREEHNAAGRARADADTRALVRALEERVGEIRDALGLPAGEVRIDLEEGTEDLEAPGAAADSVDFDQVVNRLVETGLWREALPAIERAVESLTSRAGADDGGFDLSDLLDELRAMGRTDVAAATEEAVDYLQQHGRSLTGPAAGIPGGGRRGPDGFWTHPTYGYRFRFPEGSDRAGQELITGEHEPFGSEVFRSLVEAEGVVVDFGAGIGHYSMLAAGIVRPWHGRVVAVEPRPGLASALRANLAANGLHHVEVVSSPADAGLLREQAGVLPGLVRVDAESPAFSGLSGLRQILEAAVPPRVIIGLAPGEGKESARRELYAFADGAFDELFVIEERTQSLVPATWTAVQAECATGNYMNLLGIKHPREA